MEAFEDEPDYKYSTRRNRPDYFRRRRSDDWSHKASYHERFPNKGSGRASHGENSSDEWSNRASYREHSRDKRSNRASYHDPSSRSTPRQRSPFHDREHFESEESHEPDARYDVPYGAESSAYYDIDSATEYDPDPITGFSTRWYPSRPFVPTSTYPTSHPDAYFESNDRKEVKLFRRQILDSFTDMFDSMDARVLVAMNWDPLRFLRSQFPNCEAPDKIVGDIITLTGSPEVGLQAMSCTQYLEKSWPDLANTILNLLRGALRRGYGESHEEICPDGTSVSLCIKSNGTWASAFGIPESVAYIGELLAWLGAALRCNQSAEEPAVCEAEVEQSDSHAWSIMYNLIPLQALRRSSNCWTGLFRNPVVALSRERLDGRLNGYGLEMPFNMMASLVQTKYLTHFEGNMFLKGFSSMLFPTLRQSATIYWHLLYNEDGTRISYKDPRLNIQQDRSLQEITYSDMERSRHVVGWSSRVELVAGSDQGHYDIRRSGLKNERNGVVLDKVSISAGKYVNAGASFAVGVKDIPLYLSSEGPYRHQIQDAFSNYVVFYGVDDGRAWLLNGATALLHVVWTSIYDYMDPRSLFATRHCFDPKYFREARKPYNSDAAVEMLLNQRNLDLVIDRYKGPEVLETTRRTDRYGRRKRAVKREELVFTFQNLVEQKWHILEQIMDFQQRQTPSGYQLKWPCREHLRGFDFTDVANRTMQLVPRKMPLKRAERGWVRLTRAIRAITLFGKGFGEVIQPVWDDYRCHSTRMPKESGYLAVCVRDLIEIFERRGDLRSMRLADGVYWDIPHGLFEEHRCTVLPPHRGRHQVRNDAACGVQVQCLTKRPLNGVLRDYILHLALDGAILFGKRPRFS